MNELLKQGLKWVFYLVVSVTLFACGTEDSEDVDVSDIYASVRADVGENGTARIRIDLQEGSSLGKSLDLSGGDQLQLSFNGQDIPIQKDHDLLDIDYEASLDTQGSSGVFSFAFVRQGKVSVATDASLGESFSIVKPAKGSVFESSDAYIDVDWTSTNQPLKMELFGKLTCDTIEDDFSLDTDTENEEYDLQDTGSGTLPLFDLISNLILEVTLEDEEIIATNPCDLSFELARTDEAPLTGFVAGSTIRIRQIRSSYTYKVFGIDSD